MDDLLAGLRDADRRAYLAILLAPEPKRAALAVLASYEVELARIPLTVSEAAAGEIRLKWWEEVVRGDRTEEAAGHPLARALEATIRAHDLPREPLANMADARRFDLYSDPMADRAAFEAYAGATASVPIQLAVQCLDPNAANRSADAAGHAGVYRTIIDRTALLSRDRAGERQFLPSDMLWMSGIPAGTLDRVEAGSNEADALVTDAMRYADEHFERARTAIRALPKVVRPAFAAIVARRPMQKAIERIGGPVLGTLPRVSPLKEQWAIWRGW